MTITMESRAIHVSPEVERRTLRAMREFARGSQSPCPVDEDQVAISAS